MNLSPENDSLPPYDPGEQSTYSLKIVAELTGVSSQMILTYQEQGLIRPVESTGQFDDETIHTVRQIEHLRSTSGANLAGIKLILELLDKVDQLKAALRARR
jgi:MerR family transcriptional regulator, heat shock protein HspR